MAFSGIDDEPSSIHLSVSYRGQVTTGSFSRDARLSDLTTKIRDESSIPPEFQRLVFRGERIDGARSRAEGGVEEDDPLLSSLGLRPDVEPKQNRILLVATTAEDAAAAARGAEEAALARRRRRERDVVNDLNASWLLSSSL